MSLAVDRKNSQRQSRLDLQSDVLSVPMLTNNFSNFPWFLVSPVSHCQKVL